MERERGCASATTTTSDSTSATTSATNEAPSRGDRSAKKEPTALPGSKNEAVTVGYSSKITKRTAKEGAAEDKYCAEIEDSTIEGTTFTCMAEGNIVGTSEVPSRQYCQEMH